MSRRGAQGAAGQEGEFAMQIEDDGFEVARFAGGVEGAEEAAGFGLRLREGDSGFQAGEDADQHVGLIGLEVGTDQNPGLRHGRVEDELWPA